MSGSTAALVRCAIYTRKSSEEGLDQAFNSLDAQREACEAYIKSQSHEGWRPVKAAYDDGGVSGGTLERPALQRLLRDVDLGLIDTIVVYKIDRLTRSLSDFARIVERLEARASSFVSVTQAFNTTTSMGRLTLNVLLSFAQFEREVTGERIRDKVAASKRKGMWMGGNLPLGYDAPTDLQTRALAVNQGEAEIVKTIFQLYLELGSVSALEARLDAMGVRSKSWRSKAGRMQGGAMLSRGALYHLLQNSIYLGEIPHGRETYPGAHTAIVPVELFDKVQKKLASQRRARKDRPTRSARMPLTGMIFDSAGRVMSPAFGYGSKGKVYRYYVSASLQQGKQRRNHDESLRRISAPAIEDGLRVALAKFLGAGDGVCLTELLRPVRRVEVQASGLHLVLALKDVPRTVRARLEVDPGDPTVGGVQLDVTCRIRGGRSWIVTSDGKSAINRRDPVLIRGLRQAHRLAADLGWRLGDGALAARDGTAPKSTHDRRLCCLSFLAPDIQAAILEGRQPSGLTLEHLLRTEIPRDWSKQRQTLGFG